MGADHGTDPIIDGIINALNSNEISQNFSIIAIGDGALLESRLKHPKVEIVHTDDYMRMNEPSASAVKRKNTSIYVGTEILKNGQASALISAGHSGATMSLATLKLGRINGVSRPAICTMMPTVKGHPSLILDAGANTDCKPKFLVDFALMGYEYCKHFLGNHSPKVGILANGEEESKGNELTKEVFKLLKQYPFFVGNAEGSDIFKGEIDVIVCDGYSGNIALKASEGVASSIFKILKEEVQKSILSKIGALFMRQSFKAIKSKLDYAEYGGAPLLGIRGNVLISHGKSNKRAIESAIKQAVKIAQIDMPSKLTQTFSQVTL